MHLNEDEKFLWKQMCRQRNGGKYNVRNGDLDSTE